MNVQEILRDLTAKGVKAGVDQDEILKFFQDRAYCTDFVLAKGKKPVDVRMPELNIILIQMLI